MVATAHRSADGFNARPMITRKYHYPVSSVIAVRPLRGLSDLSCGLPFHGRRKECAWCADIQLSIITRACRFFAPHY